MKCVMTDGDESCPLEDMECCPGSCNPSQCCFCCFLGTVDNKKLTIKIFGSELDKADTDSRFELSDYCSDCWQPPKKA